MPTAVTLRQLPPASRFAARLAVARLLAAREPIPGDAAAAALGWSLDRWWSAVSMCHWFRVTGKGWVLTAAGRDAIFSGGEERDGETGEPA